MAQCLPQHAHLLLNSQQTYCSHFSSEVTAASLPADECDNKLPGSILESTDHCCNDVQPISFYIFIGMNFLRVGLFEDGSKKLAYEDKLGISSRFIYPRHFTRANRLFASNYLFQIRIKLLELNG